MDRRSCFAFSDNYSFQEKLITHLPKHLCLDWYLYLSECLWHWNCFCKCITRTWTLWSTWLWCPWNHASCWITLLPSNHSVQLTMTPSAPAPAPNYSCVLPPSFMGLTDVKDFLTQSEAVSGFSNWVSPNPEPRPHLFSTQRWCTQFLTVPHRCPKRQLPWIQVSFPATKQTQRCRFEGPNQLCTGPSVTLPEKPIPMMPHAMSTSSPNSSKSWPILSLAGKCEELNQQWLRRQLVWRLQCNLIWTSTADSRQSCRVCQQFHRSFAIS